MTHSKDLENFLPKTTKVKSKSPGAKLFGFINGLFVIVLLVFAGLKASSALVDVSQNITGGKLVDFTRILVFGFFTRIGALLLLLLLVYDLFYFIRWSRALKFTQNMICPHCETRLRRKHRKTFDQIISKLFPLRRYGCRKCEVDFLVPKYTEEKLGKRETFFSPDEIDESVAARFEFAAVAHGLQRELQELLHAGETELVQLLKNRLPEISEADIITLLKQAHVRIATNPQEYEETATLQREQQTQSITTSQTADSTVDANGNPPEPTATQTMNGGGMQ